MPPIAAACGPAPDATPFGHGQALFAAQITQLLRQTWFTPTAWGEALFKCPRSPAAGSCARPVGVGAGWRGAVAAVRGRRHIVGGDQAGLSRESRRTANARGALIPSAAAGPGARHRAGR